MDVGIEVTVAIVGSLSFFFGSFVSQSSSSDICVDSFNDAGGIACVVECSNVLVTSRSSLNESFFGIIKAFV